MGIKIDIMTISTLISSIILYVLADYFQAKYKYTGKIKYSKWYKVCFVGCVFCAIMIPANPILIAVWVLWHYPTQQIGQGLLRHGKPLYLGVGEFDMMIKKVTGKRKWLYISSLVISLTLGIWLYLRFYC